MFRKFSGQQKKGGTRGGRVSLGGSQGARQGWRSFEQK